jgi:hypothetical protein
MKLDFCFHGKLEPQCVPFYNQIVSRIEKPFINLIDSLSRQHAKSVDWWVSSPASRNTFASPLFHYCCCIALLQELIRGKEHFTEIITDSKVFKRIIEDYLAKQRVNAGVTWVRLPAKQRLKELVRPIYTIFGLPLKQLLLFFAAKLTRSLRKPLPAEQLTLIDTFVMLGYIEKDRYYPGLLEALSEEEKQHVWFVPHLYGFRPWHYLSVLKRLRKAERNFISKDDFLKFRDYWSLWKHLFRVRKLQIKPTFFRGVDISSLVREELTGYRGVSSSYIPLLNYCFAKRLKKAGVKLRLVIDWFENQNIDRGWNAGFRRFFPDTETIGYQGFIVSAHYLCMYPTEIEKDSRVIPHKVAIIGSGLAQSARRFCSELDVCIAPAFRFQHVWQKRKYFPAVDGHTVLVALPIMINEAVHILKLLAHAANEMADNTRFWIKPHPTASKSQIQTAFGTGWPDSFEFVGGDFNDCVEKSNLLISSASSACMETLAKGIPVIVVGNNSGLTHNPIPKTITDDIWRLCYSSGDITKAIQFYKSRSQEKIKEHEEAGRRIREEYFEPITRDGVREFLGLSKKRKDH